MYAHLIYETALKIDQFYFIQRNEFALRQFDDIFLVKHNKYRVQIRK